MPYTLLDWDLWIKAIWFFIRILFYFQILLSLNHSISTIVMRQLIDISKGSDKNEELYALIMLGVIDELLDYW